MNNMSKELTIVIKTFNRSASLLRLLDSIVKMGFDYPIIVLDDSKKPTPMIAEKFPMLDIEYIVTEFDIGLSKGRNILVEHVKTSYFLLCDDDFVFDERTKLNICLSLIKSSDYSILGGITYSRNEINSLFALLTFIKYPSRFIDLVKKREIDDIYNGSISVTDNHVVIELDKTVDNFLDEDIYATDICMNFFIAKTGDIKSIKGWQPESAKVGEHHSFFIRAKLAGLKVAYTKHLGVVHYPKKSINYNKYRLRAAKMEKLAFQHNGFKSVLVKHKDKLEIDYRRKE